MITRTWRGWTTPSNADAYQALLLGRIFPGIADRKIAGYLGIRLDRRAIDGEVEFLTTMLFESLDAVISFAGPRYSIAVVPVAAQELLSRYDAESAHYEAIAGTGVLSVPAPAR